MNWETEKVQNWNLYFQRPIYFFSPSLCPVFGYQTIVVIYTYWSRVCMPTLICEASPAERITTIHDTQTLHSAYHTAMSHTPSQWSQGQKWLYIVYGNITSIMGSMHAEYVTTPLKLMTRSSVKQIKPTCSSFQSPDSRHAGRPIRSVNMPVSVSAGPIRIRQKEIPAYRPHNCWKV